MCSSQGYNLKYLRALPGGRQVTFLIASSKFYTDEKVLKKQLGHAYNADSACTAARVTQVTHPVNKKQYPGRENFIKGKPVSYYFLLLCSLIVLVQK